MAQGYSGRDAPGSSSSDALTLYHCQFSRSTRPLWLWRELQKTYPESLPEFKLHLFNMAEFRVNKPEWYLKINPNGKVPCLAGADGLTITESGAICLHFLDQYDKDQKLIPGPVEPEARARFYQIAFYCTGTIDNLTAKSSPWQMARAADAPLYGTEDQEEKRRAWKEISAPFLQELKQKGGGKYMLGDSFTAADVFVGLNLFYLHEMKGWLEDTPEWMTFYEEHIRSRADFLDAVGGPGPYGLR